MTADLGIDFFAELRASINGLKEAADREARWRQRCAEAVRQIPFAGMISLTAGAGTTTRDRDKLQAKTGYCWSIRRLTVYGFNAGTVTAYRNDLNGEPLCPFPVAAVNTFGRGEMMLMPGDALLWNATGISLTSGANFLAYWGTADCFESWYLPFYIG